MTTVTEQQFPETLATRITEISEGDHDLVERDRQSIERSCLRSHCKRVWEQLTSAERGLIRQAEKNKMKIFKDADVSDALLEAQCIKQVEELIQEAGCYSMLI